jgi:hypothetical protein
MRKAAAEFEDVRSSKNFASYSFYDDFSTANCNSLAIGVVYSLYFLFTCFAA